MTMEEIQVSATVAPEEAVSSLGESDPYSSSPLWAHVTSTVILSLTIAIGLPLNGATVLIFYRRKKLRHLVNFVLLLDCLSHIALCLVCIPLHFFVEWRGTSSFLAFPAEGDLSVVANSQQVIGDFVNIYSTFLTVSIAVLRHRMILYFDPRRLCSKKKDMFSIMNAVKWTVSNAVLAVAAISVQTYVVMVPESKRMILYVYIAKIAVILLSVAAVSFLYVRVSMKVWANIAHHEDAIMDPVKLRKSRNFHMKAAIHSLMQIVLIVLTMAPHLYLHALEMLDASAAFTQPQTGSGSVTTTTTGGRFEHVAQPILSHSKRQHPQELFSIQQLIQNIQPDKEKLAVSLKEGQPSGGSQSDYDWMDKISHPRHPHHRVLLNGKSFVSNPNKVEEDYAPPNDESIRNRTVSKDDSDKYLVDQEGTSNQERGTLQENVPEEATAKRFTGRFGTGQLAKLIAITVNYALLVLGTPFAYIASCHRFREQFTNILRSYVGNSPQNSTGHVNQNGHHQNSSPGHRSHYYRHRSTTCGTQDACLFSSPLTRGEKTSTTRIDHHSSLVSKNSLRGHSNRAMLRESVSISANTRSSFSQSFKSRSSMKKSIGGTSIKRRRSSTDGLTAAGSVGGFALGTGGIKGLSVAPADSVFIESEKSESALIPEQDVSNGSSSTRSLKRSPSATGGDDVSGRTSSSSGDLVKKSWSCQYPLTAITTIAGTSANLQTYLPNGYGDYHCGTDLGQLV